MVRNGGRYKKFMFIGHFSVPFFFFYYFFLVVAVVPLPPSTLSNCDSCVCNLVDEEGNNPDDAQLISGQNCMSIYV